MALSRHVGPPEKSAENLKIFGDPPKHLGDLLRHVTSHTVTSNALPAVTDLHRCDLTKEQRDDHIRRYAELLEKQREVSRQNDAKPVSGPQGGRPQGIARQIADETGLSKRTVERVLNLPAPKPKVVDIKSALKPESDHDAIIREANALAH